MVAPLDETVPPGLRRNISLLRESLLDEAKSKPAAGPEAYALGSQLCDALIAVLDERDQTLSHYGYRVAQVEANMQLSNESLNVDRNYQMRWPQYARERDQAARIFRQEQSAAEVKKELPKVEWADRAMVFRRKLDAQYKKYRTALRDTKK